jgi:hypothetical protein
LSVGKKLKEKKITLINRSERSEVIVISIDVMMLEKSAISNQPLLATRQFKYLQ